MAFEQAMKLLEKEIPPIPTNEWPQNTQAKALAIEAFKRLNIMRSYGILQALLRLKGETRLEDTKLQP